MGIVEDNNGRVILQIGVLRCTVSAFERSDLRQAGRESCSIQRHQKPVEAVASLEMEISRSTVSVSEHKEPNMKEIRPIRSAGVTSSNTKVSVKAKVVSFLAAASLAMVVVGNHSA